MLSYSFGPRLERPPIGRTFASRLRAPKSILLVRRPKPDSYFLQILTQTSACFRCVTSPAPCHPLSSRTVMTSEWHLHPLAHTRVNTCFNSTSNQPMCWGARGVVVIAVGNEHGDTSSNPGRDWLHFTLH